MIKTIKNLKQLALIIATMLLLLSCNYKNTKKDTKKFSNRLGKDTFKLKGTYYWNFKLMGALQESVNTFYADSIAYQMKGKIYSTKYTMQKLSYNNTEKRWIGQDSNKTVYVMFFKEQTDSSVVIYKHKCKTKGLEEALNFAYPKPDATDDHGWNTYYTKGKKIEEDKLPFKGNYIQAENKLFVTDKIINFNGKEYKKLSYHKGERRWVGHNKTSGEYLQIFHKPIQDKNSLYLLVKKYTDIEKMYKTKYQEKELINYKINNN